MSVFLFSFSVLTVLLKAFPITDIGATNLPFLIIGSTSNSYGLPFFVAFCVYFCSVMSIFVLLYILLLLLLLTTPHD